MRNYKKVITFSNNKVMIRQNRLHEYLTETEHELFNMLVDKIVDKQDEEENAMEGISWI